MHSEFFLMSSFPEKLMENRKSCACRTTVEDFYRSIFLKLAHKDLYKTLLGFNSLSPELNYEESFRKFAFLKFPNTHSCCIYSCVNEDLLGKRQVINPE
jgi:hypothetical protein